MYIRGIRLTNYGRFRGDHELELDRGVYAIVARHESDAMRSNWFGKSFLLSAVRYALMGLAPTKTLDAAISYGESAMAVDLELSDGLFITRSKARGKSEDLRIISPEEGGCERELFAGPAQTLILERIGLSPKDFENTVWLGQKDMARMITAQPSDRTATFAEWLALGPVDAAAQRVGASIAKLEREAVEVRSRLSVHLGRTQGDPAALEADVRGAEAGLQRAQVLADRVEQAAVARVSWEASQRPRRALADAKAMAVTVEKEQPKLPAEPGREEAERTRTAMQANADMAKATVDRLRLLVAGQFDGQCPVICERCPIEGDIRGRRERARPAYDAAVRDLEQRQIEAAAALKKLLDIQGQLKTFNDWRRRMDDAATRVATCEQLSKGQIDQTEAPPAVPERPDVAGAADVLSRARQALQQYEQARGEATVARGELDAIEADLEVRRAAIQILGRGGAQRRIAQSVLGSIEAGANRRMERAGIDLTMRIVYGRELQTIAEVCDCGKAFPRSATAKACERCGATRGKKRDVKSYIELSNTSGAAEDLVGVALQLAAARWLQRARQSQWSSVMLDEPGAACDRANRHALMKSVSNLMSDGFEQGFVISHSDDILDSMPHRIIITASGQWSKVEVG